MTDKAPALAAAFAALLHRDLNPVEWATMRVRNITAGEGVCASHDFCDANMTMFEAAESLALPVVGEVAPGSVEEGDALALWNAAWDMAKADYLTERATLDDLTEAYSDYLEREGITHDGDAMEFLMTDAPTPDQRAWVSRFVARWDAIDAADLAETVRAHGG